MFSNAFARRGLNVVSHHCDGSSKVILNFTKGVGCLHRLMHTGPREGGYCK
jgi:hypothetical protein